MVHQKVLFCFLMHFCENIVPLQKKTMLNIEELTEWAITLKGATEEYKESWDAHLVKVSGKMFMLFYADSDGNITLSLKCDPEWAIELRDSHSSIIAGYHLSKKHWNTISLQDELPSGLLKKMIIHSYEMVAKGLTKRQKEELESI